MASPFGGGFKPASTFGTPQPAAGGGLFGSPLPGTSTFGGFGSATPSTPAFGGFGTPAGANSSPLGFGQASAPSLFGAASTSAPAFGQAQPQQGGIFGGTTTAAGSAPATGGAFNLFGSSAPAGTASSSAGLFSSTFGTQQPQPAFGALTVPGTTGASPFGNLFGGQQQQQQQQQQAAAGLPGQPGQGDAAAKEITEIKAAYTPGAPTFRFQHLFLNVVDNPAQRVKPAGVDEMRWRQAMASAGGPDNPDRLWPVVANGFGDLVARLAAQSAALEENSSRLKQLGDIALGMQRRHQGEFKQRAADVQRTHVELSHRLLHVFRLLDALESRLATSIGYQGSQARAQEAALSKRLTAVESEVAPNAPSGLTRRLEGVAAGARLRAGANMAAAASQAKLDERGGSQLLAVLKDHADGIAKLQTLLRRDALDIEIMRSEGTSARGGAGDGGRPGGRSTVMLLD